MNTDCVIAILVNWTFIPMQETKFECKGESCYYKDNLESTVLLFFVFNKSLTDIELMLILV